MNVLWPCEALSPIYTCCASLPGNIFSRRLFTFNKAIQIVWTESTCVGLDLIFIRITNKFILGFMGNILNNNFSLWGNESLAKTQGVFSSASAWLLKKGGV